MTRTSGSFQQLGAKRTAVASSNVAFPVSPVAAVSEASSAMKMKGGPNSLLRMACIRQEVILTPSTQRELVSSNALSPAVSAASANRPKENVESKDKFTCKVYLCRDKSFFDKTNVERHFKDNSKIGLGRVGNCHQLLYSTACAVQTSRKKW